MVWWGWGIEHGGMVCIRTRYFIFVLLVMTLTIIQTNNRVADSGEDGTTLILRSVTLVTWVYDCLN